MHFKSVSMVVEAQCKEGVRPCKPCRRSEANRSLAQDYASRFYGHLLMFSCCLLSGKRFGFQLCSGSQVLPVVSLLQAGATYVLLPPR